MNHRFPSSVWSSRGQRASRTRYRMHQDLNYTGTARFATSSATTVRQVRHYASTSTVSRSNLLRVRNTLTSVRRVQTMTVTTVASQQQSAQEEMFQDFDFQNEEQGPIIEVETWNSPGDVQNFSPEGYFEIGIDAPGLGGFQNAAPQHNNADIEIIFEEPQGGVSVTQNPDFTYTITQETGQTASQRTAQNSAVYASAFLPGESVVDNVSEDESDLSEVDNISEDEHGSNDEDAETEVYTSGDEDEIEGNMSSTEENAAEEVAVVVPFNYCTNQGAYDLIQRRLAQRNIEVVNLDDEDSDE